MSMITVFYFFKGALALPNNIIASPLPKRTWVCDWYPAPVPTRPAGCSFNLYGYLLALKKETQKNSSHLAGLAWGDAEASAQTNKRS